MFRWVPDSHALAHCVGADLRMGAGIAVDFKQKFGNVAYLRQQGKVPGQVAVLPPQACGRAAPVFYLVTKQRSTDYSPVWENFASSVQELARLCEEMGVKEVSMPRIGAGRDHLPWGDVYNLLLEVFMKTSTTVTIFNFQPPRPGNPFPLVKNVCYIITSVNIQICYLQLKKKNLF